MPPTCAAGAEALGPMAQACPGEMYTDAPGMQPHGGPRAMTAAGIDQAVAEYAKSARLAVDAGVDGVEPHAAGAGRIQGAAARGVQGLVHPRPRLRSRERGTGATLNAPDMATSYTPGRRAMPPIRGLLTEDRPTPARRTLTHGGAESMRAARDRPRSGSDGPR
ncbi:MAG: hypothetical protein KGL43_00500 [Burkholderiales bacterium]|nr:hypothetical protein [Burkholderiales bacterium]MDE2452047.1 hypothetical protein [Burkholderiales bacterium]